MRNGGPDTWGESPVPEWGPREPTYEELMEDARRGFLCPTHLASWDDCDCPFTPEAEARYGKNNLSAGEKNQAAGLTRSDPATQPTPARRSA